MCNYIENRCSGCGCVDYRRVLDCFYLNGRIHGPHGRPSSIIGRSNDYTCRRCRGDPPRGPPFDTVDPSHLNTTDSHTVPRLDDDIGPGALPDPGDQGIDPAAIYSGVPVQNLPKGTPGWPPARRILTRMCSGAAIVTGLSLLSHNLYRHSVPTKESPRHTALTTRTSFRRETQSNEHAASSPASKVDKVVHPAAELPGDPASDAKPDGLGCLAIRVTVTATLPPAVIKRGSIARQLEHDVHTFHSKMPRSTDNLSPPHHPSGRALNIVDPNKGTLANQEPAAVQKPAAEAASPEKKPDKNEETADADSKTRKKHDGETAKEKA
ncbi:hypothetical protein B0T22DRAFT_479963 [Podospora appendiculata]|uniref:Uncharacterized protein n=1 Tax=Podospora appendiculata TaxID=314037 RepID=A0AAE0X9V7_9PEZI|nr:hypothetical protein B0T22DRAFT_479963 [Podospora appendiculata]